MDLEETKTAPKPPKKVKKPKNKAKSAKRKTKKASKPKKTKGERSERLDMRLTKPERAKLVAKAKKLRRTVTSIVIEAIEKLR